MALFLSLFAFKGGVTKTALARAISTDFARGGWKVGVCDIDLGQVSTVRWMQRRIHYGHEPVFPVITGDMNTARKMRDGNEYQLVVCDGAAYGSVAAFQSAEMADLCIVPTRFTLDDMESAVEACNLAVLKGIPKERFAIVFSGVPESRSEASYLRAKAWMEQTGYYIVPGYIEQKTSLADAMNEGLSIGEVQFETVRQKIDVVLQGISDRLQYLTSEK